MSSANLAQSIGRELPYLRRYARALTGSQTAGDNYAPATLEAILTDRSVLQDEDDTRLGLFRTFHAIWQSSGQPVAEADSVRERRAQDHLRRLTPNSREALLLRTIEELRYDQIARVMQVDQREAEELVQIALNEMGQAISGKVMVIEDEMIIAMDLKGIVQAMGHEVTGVARTHTQAVDLAGKARPDLILADEPTGNLDEATSDRVLEEFLRLVRGQGSSALVATHNERLAAKMDRVVRLHDGVLA